MICQYLELGVGNAPIFVGRAFLEYLLVLNHVVDLVLTSK
jgi:hypothetical protein